MTTRSYRFCIGVTLVVLASCANASKSSREEIVYRAQNWTEVHEAYRHFRGRIDGVVAGAFVDKISELLDERWASVAELQRLVQRDRRFGMFVTEHLNEAVSADRATRIKNHAEHSCPTKSLSLCREIAKKLQ